jgi:hypothetical protein
VNVTARVEQCTKDHPYHVLCTEAVMIDVLSELEGTKSDNPQSYFVPLGKRLLRGFPRAFVLYHFKKGFHRCV